MTQSLKGRWTRDGRVTPGGRIGLFVVAVLFGIPALWVVVPSVPVLLDPVSTQATVFAVDMSHRFPNAYRAEIRYQTQSGRTVESTIKLNRPRRSRYIAVDEKIPIAYRRTDPGQAIPDDYLGDWPGTLPFFGVAVFCLWKAWT